MENTDSKKVLAIIQDAIGQLESPRLRSQVLTGIFGPVCEQRTFQTDGGEAQGNLWIFYVVPNRNIALAYSEEGYGTFGIRWGLIRTDDDQYSSSGGWYLSLAELLVESGYFSLD